MTCGPCGVGSVGALGQRQQQQDESSIGDPLKATLEDAKGKKEEKGKKGKKGKGKKKKGGGDDDGDGEAAGCPAAFVKGIEGGVQEYVNTWQDRDESTNFFQVRVLPPQTGRRNASLHLLTPSAPVRRVFSR